MSFLISDSLADLVDERTLMNGFDILGEVILGDSKYVIDAYIADMKNIRFYAVAPPDVPLSLLDLSVGHEVRVKLGEVFEATGKITQIGWDDTPRGGRVVFCMSR
jgi:hypothetical protein